MHTIKGGAGMMMFNKLADLAHHMENMFYLCSGLTSLNLSNWNTSKVTDMRDMFYGCSGLASLDLSNFNTSKVAKMGGMFSGCTGLTSIDLSYIDPAVIFVDLENADEETKNNFDKERMEIVDLIGKNNVYFDFEDEEF